MKRFFMIALTVFASLSVSAEAVKVDLTAFANDYFEKMVASQAPNASKEDLEAYLALLVDDIGHSHIPWDNDDSRLADGKVMMRKGMTYYLGAHTEYKAEILNLFIFNDSAIAIRYRHQAKGIHPSNKQHTEYDRIMMEVLEMEGNKVAVIRKYHE